MSTLAGARLEEMADIRSTRKKKIVFLCSSIAATLLVYGAIVQSLENHWGLSVLHAFSAIACLGICYLIKVQRHHKYADLLLSAVIMFEGLLLLLFNDAPSGKLLWLYPIVATIILINEFKVGLLFSATYMILVFFGITFLDGLPATGDMIERRFMFTLIAISFVCHTFSYYYAKVVSYIQTLYREGIEELAYLDQLTGLANRWSFETWARAKLHDIDHSDERSVTALVFLDIDNFKYINDTYGHDVGDQVLKAFATRLKKSIRNSDRKTDKHDYSIARFAGDEFVLMLYDVRSKQDLDGILDRIVNLFPKGYQNYDTYNELTMSVGAAIYKQDANDLSELTRCADKAMYAAKHTGKNQYAFYEHCSHAGELSKQQESMLEMTEAC
ncbi:GGDEF domain-containing protein [Vibrio parahaemolyticus]|uniref:GGDEF domain-containing protein n=1 Tax=Vibrio parahaemolyticus TaxID=670 RepID=UPI0011208D65|nr:GGDEF domain-containing protein [Vibrio parahaemolyticus]TOG71634.1 GGDEF domain-containing protein [Vibrio parahaemolyticus]